MKDKTRPARRARYAFGELELTTQPFALTKAGERIDLAPQPAKVLVLLVRSAGEVVGREEIRDCIWGQDSFVDHVKGINFVIHQIRTALGDQASAPTFVETVPREGYRFVAAVSTPTEVEEASEVSSTLPPPSPAPVPASAPVPAPVQRRRPPSRIRLGLGVVAGLLAVGVLIVTLGLSGRLGRSGSADEIGLDQLWHASRPSLAIFAVSESAGGEEQHVPFGATELLTTRLTESFGENLEILAPPPGVAIQENLLDEAEYALSVTSFGDEGSPEMVIRLSRCHPNTVLWAFNEHVTWKDFPKVFDHVVEEVAENLHVEAVEAAEQPH